MTVIFSQAEERLNWQPTSFEQAIVDTVHFYENAFKDENFSDNRNEIIQVGMYIIQYVLVDMD